MSFGVADGANITDGHILIRMSPGATRGEHIELQGGDHFQRVAELHISLAHKDEIIGLPDRNRRAIDINQTIDPWRRPNQNPRFIRIRRKPRFGEQPQGAQRDCVHWQRQPNDLPP